MTNITQTPDSYPEGVYQLAVTDPVLGGPEGHSNKSAIDLANRTAYQRMRNVTPWRPGLENEYPAHSYVQHAGVTWKSLVANANIEPGTNVAKWIRWGYTSAELEAFLGGYMLTANPNLAQVINNTYIGPQPTTQRAFSGGLVLADMAAMNVENTLQTIVFTGARRVSINAHASFKNENTTTSVNITQRMKLNGADVFAGHYLGASLPAMTNAGANVTQIPITISDSVYGLNPALTYTLTLHATRQSNVGPVKVLDSYIGIEFI